MAAQLEPVNEENLSEVADLIRDCKSLLESLDCAESVETQRDLIANLREAQQAAKMLLDDIGGLIGECT